jgi:hypothetical protein
MINASRLEKVGSTPDCCEHVQNCRMVMPMFHQDCSTASPRMYKKHPDFANRDHSGQNLVPIEVDFSQLFKIRDEPWQNWVQTNRGYLG